MHEIDQKLTGKRVAVLLFSEYPEDARPRRAAEALAHHGAEVDLFCLQMDAEEPRRERLEGGIQVFRVPIPKSKKSRFGYVLQYGSFLAYCFGMLLIRHPRRRYHVVHVHNMPDILVFSALIPRLFGSKVILDMHDPMPELMTSIYGMDPNSKFVNLLKLLERWSICFAQLVITPNIAFQERFVERGCPREKIQIVMNSPESNFSASLPQKRVAPRGPEDRFSIMHHGLLAERHGLDVALRAVARLSDRIPNLEFHVYGRPNEYSESMEALARDLGIGDQVLFHGYVPHKEVADAIQAADLGVIPNRRNDFTEINMPTRIFEYLALNTPVIVPSTTGIRDYFSDDSMFFFEPEDDENLAEAIYRVFEDQARTEQVVDRGREVYESFSWEEQEKKFLHLASTLV